MAKTKELKLNIACGQLCEDGWTGIDIVKCKAAPPIRDENDKIIRKFKDVDIVHDLNKYPWPIKSNSVDEAYISHYVEHIPMGYMQPNGEVTIIPKSLKAKELFFCFYDELCRILKKGAKCTVIGPYYSSIRCWQDPTHRRTIGDTTFLYLNKKWREDNKLDHYNCTCDFDYSYGHVVNPPWNMKSEEARNFAIQHYNNSVSDIQVTLVKR